MVQCVCGSDGMIDTESYDPFLLSQLKMKYVSTLDDLVKYLSSMHLLEKKTYHKKVTLIVEDLSDMIYNHTIGQVSDSSSYQLNTRTSKQLSLHEHQLRNFLSVMGLLDNTIHRLNGVEYRATDSAASTDIPGRQINLIITASKFEIQELAVLSRMCPLFLSIRRIHSGVHIQGAQVFPSVSATAREDGYGMFVVDVNKLQLPSGPDPQERPLWICNLRSNRIIASLVSS
jgi:hypothetical protein